MSATEFIYDELLLVTNALEEPRLYFRVSSKGWRQVEVAEVEELVPDDVETFTAFYELAGVTPS
jgi:glucose-6-phosphate isomerase